MTNRFSNFAAFVGRLVVGGFYLYYGINNVVDFAGMAGYAAFKGVPLPGLAVIVGAILLILGGLSLLTGYRPTLGIAVLVIFLLPVTMLMHNYWTITDPQMRVIEQGLWMRNMALAGAALWFLAIPRPWSWSIDSLLARPSANQTVQLAR
ncbi:MAG: DoxX family protein [Caldilinea sp. CFX5]|nr:DoxX family protein [Caldilinea sp. CFX5]